MRFPCLNQFVEGELFVQMILQNVEIEGYFPQPKDMNRPVL